MRSQVICFAVFGWICAAPCLYAVSEQTTVEIHNVDDRVKATVTSPKSAAQPAAEPRLIEKPILAVEDTTVGVAGQSTKLVGRGTDAAVGTVQKVGDSFFAKVFRALDVSRWNQSHQNGQKGVNDGRVPEKKAEEKSS